jgi:GH15 family glucan-1,4-alpha-glucosidase
MKTPLQRITSDCSLRGHATSAYKSIQDYGIIGDLHSVALVGTDGSIDWYCYPHFDSPSVFAAILDNTKGGHFQIRTTSEAVQQQLYFPDTNILITRFLSSEGVGEVTDFMPIDTTEGQTPRHWIIRKVGSVRGHVSFSMECKPAFDYARARHRTDIRKEGAVFRTNEKTLGLAASVPISTDENGVRATFTLREGKTSTFVLEGLDSQSPKIASMDEDEAEREFRNTAKYWRRWLSQSRYRGRWTRMVTRSALVLKLLTFQPSGAIVASPTCSLPEVAGGERNWDYRYAWIRDAAFTVYALLRIGFTGEARAFMDWLMARISESTRAGELQPVYTISGGSELDEKILSHLDGYMRSKPVRIGNAAAKQIQLDVYGALMDSVYLFNKYATPISYELWCDLREILNWLCRNWGRSDSGIWEIREKARQFVYSKMMCWVALDRGIRLADKRGFPAEIERWRKTRDTIYEEIMSKGWDQRRQAFVQSFGSKALDASALLMPLVFFVSPTDPRMLKTLNAIQHELASDHLVRRYNVRQTKDGLKGNEGTFSLCTFWFVEALTRAGRLEEARTIFERMLGYANHLGLYAEEIGPQGGALGNFPQAFTHLALISAAVNLDRALGEHE